MVAAKFTGLITDRWQVNRGRQIGNQRLSHTEPKSTSPKRGLLAKLDDWMALSEWHPRVLPFVIYILGLAVMELDEGLTRLAELAAMVEPLSIVLSHLAASWRHSAVYPALYVIQCGVVVWLLWRYRSLLPELNWKFHWSAVPTAVGLCVAWIGLGYLMTSLSPWFETSGAPGRQLHDFQSLRQTNPVFFQLSMGLRLVGMSLVVPMFEELFVRSLCLRIFHRARLTAIGAMQILHDMPLIGDWVMHTDWGRHAAAKEPMFVAQFRATPLGALSIFGVVASTVVFTISHMPRDWPGCVACGLVWCVMLWWTNRGRLRLGLGPIIWSHGITNALLWGYTLYSDDWQFL